MKRTTTKAPAKTPGKTTKAGSRRKAASPVAEPDAVMGEPAVEAPPPSDAPAETGPGADAATEVEAPPEAAGDATQAARAVQPGPTEILGQVAYLFMSSPTHKHLFMTDLEWLVVPPLRLRQFRLFRRKNAPVAYASWAMLTEEAEKRLLSGVRKLQPADWNAGDRLWLIDLAAPFGGHEAILKELREKVFAGRPVKTLQPGPDGKGMRVVTLGGEKGKGEVEGQV